MERTGSVGTGLGQLYTPTALYKGSLVAYKSVGKDNVKITRDLQIEMTQVRSLFGSDYYLMQKVY